MTEVRVFVVPQVFETVLVESENDSQNDENLMRPNLTEEPYGSYRATCVGVTVIESSVPLSQKKEVLGTLPSTVYG